MLGHRFRALLSAFRRLSYIDTKTGIARPLLL
jgi:hypothetical protein